ncbi:HalOD1 output domain-containing protein [Haloterrigena salifodinae]|uniref:HalOD1 output domain-containing protein n=1 Tax=Haloterrigena salifodinae TaxID=2675099 RepID=UPI000F89CEAA|nr:HalOD1 output domain-containing protein [Haloterrigena salifodinae]
MSGTTLDYHNDSLSLSVIEALADATDTDPVELEPLYHVVDPEALDQLFQGTTPATARVQFSYGEHTVEVRGDGTILVDGTVHESP